MTGREIGNSTISRISFAFFESVRQENKMCVQAELASELVPSILCRNSGLPNRSRDGEMAEWPNAHHC